MKKLIVVGSACLFVFGLIACRGGRDETSPAMSGTENSRRLDKAVITMRVFEGSVDAPASSTGAVTSSLLQQSSLLQHQITATVASDKDAGVQGRRIREAFNLKSVALLVESSLVWEMGKSDPGYQILSIENKSYRVLIAMKDPALRIFRIDVDEQNGGPATSLLSTEAGLPTDHSTVFGFRNAQGKPYFVSLQIGEWALTGVLPGGGTQTVFSGAAGKVAGGAAGGVVGGVVGGRVEKPVAATGDVQPPKIIKRVDPVYPEKARDAGIEGTVICEATTGPDGRVISVKVLRSIPELDGAAVDAVKQWVYEPMMIEGKPRGVVFTVTIRFKLKDKAAGESEPSKGAAGGVIGGVVGGTEAPVRAVDDIRPPTLIKRVDPVYPDAARNAKIEGLVILEATTDAYGRIISVKVLRSIPELDQAAIDAIKQWVYEPMMIEGKPRGVVFTVTVRFQLKD